MDSSENLSSSQSSERVVALNCFEPGNRVKSEDGEIDHDVIGDLESVDLNTPNDCVERDSPNLTDATNTGDSTNTSMTDSPTSIPSGSQTSKKKR